jgi:hypothetical protein
VVNDLLFGINPTTKKKGSRMAKKRSQKKGHKSSAPKSSKKRGGKKRNPSGSGKKHRKKSNNPLGISTKGVGGMLGKGLALGLGALGAEVVANNVLGLGIVPASVTSSPAGAAATRAVLAIGAGWLASKVSVLKPHAESIRNGGLAVAAYAFLRPTVVPMLQFTGTKSAPAAPSGETNPGDAFILSRGGLTTADRMPSDTQNLGDAYVRTAGGGAGMQPGVSGAPNGLRAPWVSTSIYARR